MAMKRGEEAQTGGGGADQGKDGPPLEGEIIPPGATRRGASPNGVFFEMRNGEGASVEIKPVSGWKLALILIVAVGLAFAIVVTFASIFVVALLAGACLAAAAMALTWVKGLFGARK